MTINFSSPEKEQAWRQNRLRNFAEHGEKGRINAAKASRKPVKAGHPLVRQMFGLMDKESVYGKDVCKRAGLHHNSVSDWRAGRKFPKLDALEAMLGAMGYELRIMRVRSSPNDQDKEP